MKGQDTGVLYISQKIYFSLQFSRSKELLSVIFGLSDPTCINWEKRILAPECSSMKASGEEKCLMKTCKPHISS